MEAEVLIAFHSGPNKQLNLSAPLHITYLKERPAIGYHHDRYIEGTERADYRHQMSTIASRQDFVPLIDIHGNLSNPLSVIFNGHMGWERVAEMLPKDFIYEVEPKTVAIKKEP